MFREENEGALPRTTHMNTGSDLMIRIIGDKYSENNIGVKHNAYEPQESRVLHGSLRNLLLLKDIRGLQFPSPGRQ